MPWIKSFEATLLLHVPGAGEVAEIDVKVVHQVLYNLLDVGAKTFLDSLHPYEVTSWEVLRAKFLARYGLKTSDAKRMLD